VKKKTAAAAATAVAALAFAGSAYASFAPKLVVGGTPGGAARIGVVVGNGDAPTARTTIYVPSAFTVAAPAPGTALGAVTATAAAGDLAGVVLPLTGELEAVAPTSTTAAIAQTCGVAPAQTWSLHVSVSGQTLDIPLFVEATTAAEQAAGFGAKLVVCLPPPDVPAGTPGRAVLGAKLLSATFTSSAVALPAAPGDYRWTSLWTPYVPGTGQPDAAVTVEAQALQRLPVKLTTVTARKRVVASRTVRSAGKKRKVKVVVTAVGFASAVTENATHAATATITTRAGKKRVGAAKGSFLMVGLKSTRLTVTAVYDSDSFVPAGAVRTPADLAFHDLGAPACRATALFQGVPCLDATTAGGRLADTLVVKAYAR